jgi:hypothetical protein
LLLQVVAANNEFSGKLLDESISYVNANFNLHFQVKKKKAKKGQV